MPSAARHAVPAPTAGRPVEGCLSSTLPSAGGGMGAALRILWLGTPFVPLKQCFNATPTRSAAHGERWRWSCSGVFGLQPPSVGTR